MLGDDKTGWWKEWYEEKIPAADRRTKSAWRNWVGKERSEMSGYRSFKRVMKKQGSRRPEEETIRARVSEGLDEAKQFAKETDRLYLDGIAQDLVEDETVQRQAAANSQ